MKKAATKKVTKRKSPSKKAPEKIVKEVVLDTQEDKSNPQIEEPSDKKKEAISAVDNAIAQLENDENPTPLTTVEQSTESAPLDVPTDEPINVEEKTKVDEFEAKKPKMFASPEKQLPRIEKTNKKLFILGVAVFVLTILIASGVGFLILQANTNSQKEKETESSKVVVPTVEPTAAPELNREDWVFEVLNGSGKSGEAAKARTKLEALGYKVESVGNAKEKVTTTQIFITKGAPDTTKLFDDLEKDFGKLSVTGVLEEDSKATIRIVLGSE